MSRRVRVGGVIGVGARRKNAPQETGSRLSLACNDAESRKLVVLSGSLALLAQRQSE